MRKRMWLISVVAVTSAVVFFLSSYASYRVSLTQGEAPPFEFILREDVVPPSRDAYVFMPLESYTKDNLDKLFLWYHSKYIEGYRNIKISVFTNKQEMERYLEEKKNQPKGLGNITIQNKEDPSSLFERTKSHAPNPIAASCYRSPSEPLLKPNADPSSSGFDLVYFYIPNLNQPSVRKTVVLRGTSHTEGKYDLQTQETMNGENKVTLSSYNIYNVDPPGRYYSFSWESSSRKTLNGQPIPRIVFVIQQNEPISLPLNQVNFIGDKISYMYLGWMFSVTLDAGLTWHLWNAEKDLPGWKCCDPNLIQNVEIAPNGLGTMRLQGQLILQTKDYGQNWKK